MQSEKTQGGYVPLCQSHCVLLNLTSQIPLGILFTGQDLNNQQVRPVLPRGGDDVVFDMYSAVLRAALVLFSDQLFILQCCKKYCSFNSLM